MSEMMSPIFGYESRPIDDRLLYVGPDHYGRVEIKVLKASLCERYGSIYEYEDDLISRASVIESDELELHEISDGDGWTYINRASNQIAMDCKRGMANIVLMHPASMYLFPSQNITVICNQNIVVGRWKKYSDCHFVSRNTLAELKYTVYTSEEHPKDSVTCVYSQPRTFIDDKSVWMGIDIPGLFRVQDDGSIMATLIDDRAISMIRKVDISNLITGMNKRVSD